MEFRPIVHPYNNSTDLLIQLTKFWIIAAVLALTVTGCTTNQPADNPAHGQITIAADESFKPLMIEITRTYSAIYPGAKFDLVYKPEREAINMLLNDQARLAVVTRQLTPNEHQAFDKLKIKGAAVRIATDGVSLIVGKANTDTLITMPALQAIFDKKITDWQQLKGGNQTGPITLVFDNGNSSNLDFILKKFNVTDMGGLRLYTVKSNREVIDYVRAHPTALGFIGVNWISDGDAPVSTELSRDIRVLGVSPKTSPSTRNDYFQPFQRDLGLKNYPLCRDVYILSRDAHSGLGSGLINYIIRDTGPLLIEKAGLWPTKPYNREVYLQKQSF